MSKQFLRRSASLLCMLLLIAGVQSSANSQELRHASLDGTRIYYKSYGKGSEALVLIHGWSCTQDYWRDQIPDLDKRSRVIAIDLPGHGQSDKPQHVYSMDFFASSGM